MAISQSSKILAKDIRDKLRINYIEPQGSTATKNGITLTNNEDGTYTLNGTTTTDSYFQICRVRVKGKFKLTGTPRNRGNSSLYEAVDYRVDLGDGVVIEEDGSRYIEIVIAVYSGSYNNVLYKPMLTDDLDSTYDDFVSNKFKGITMNLLWTNADVYSAFPEQTVTLDTTGYKFFIAIFHGWTGQTSWVVSRLLQYGSNHVEHVRETSSRRFITVNNSSILFGNCARYTKYGDTTTTIENKNLVPVKIYGVR